MRLPSLTAKKNDTRSKESKLEDDSVNNYFSSFPSEKELSDVFGEAYIINQPMNTVGGDGYCIHQLKGLKILVVFDCMGHGHFAAMMTRFYLRAINEIIVNNSIINPGSALNQIHDLVKNSFAKKDSVTIGTGADMGILVFDENTNEITFSGAKMNLLEINETQAIIHTSNRKQIGEYFTIDRLYKSVIIPHDNKTKQKFYLYSDGVTDLFGGKHDKKLGIRGLKSILLNSVSLSMKDEKIEIKNILNKWSGSIEPLDDLLLIGVISQ